VLVDRDEILVDIGGKMEAVIATGELHDEHGEMALERGDHVSAVVIVPENSDGRPVISINRAEPKSAGVICRLKRTPKKSSPARWSTTTRAA